MRDLAQLTPSRVLLLFNAWEHPGAYLVEIFLDVVVKGGSDAVIGLGFEIYVADTNRSVVTVGEDLAWAVSNDLIDVVLEDTNLEGSLTLLSVHDLDGLLIPERSDTWIHMSIRVWLTEQGAEFWRAAATSFPLVSMSAGKTRLIETPREKSGKESRLGLVQWAPKHLGFLKRFRLRLWTTQPRKDLVSPEGDRALYLRHTNMDLRMMEGRDAWGSPILHRTVYTKNQSLEDSFTEQGPRHARIPLYGHWILDKKNGIVWKGSPSRRVPEDPSLLRRHSG
jgi:hypothetical protein